MNELDAFFESNADRHRAELFELLRIPSVSARSERRPDMQRAADWLVGSQPLQKLRSGSQALGAASKSWKSL